MCIYVYIYLFICYDSIYKQQQTTEYKMQSLKVYIEFQSNSHEYIATINVYNQVTSEFTRHSEVDTNYQSLIQFCENNRFNSRNNKYHKATILTDMSCPHTKHAQNSMQLILNKYFN